MSPVPSQEGPADTDKIISSSSAQTKLGRRLSAKFISLISPSKEKSRREAELAAPTETEGEASSSNIATGDKNVSSTSTSATSDAAPSVTTEIPAGSLITASTPIVPEINNTTTTTVTPATEEKKEEVNGATPPAAPVVAGESMTLDARDVFVSQSTKRFPLFGIAAA